MVDEIETPKGDDIKETTPPIDTENLPDDKYQELVDQKTNLEKQINDQEDTIELQNERIGDLEGQYNTVKDTLEDFLKKGDSQINNNINNMTDEIKKDEVKTPEVTPEVKPEEIPEVKPEVKPEEVPEVKPEPIQEVPREPEVDSKDLTVDERLERIEIANAEAAMERDITAAMSISPKATREGILSRLALGDSRLISDIAKDINDSTTTYEKELREKILEEEKGKIEEQIKEELAGNKSIPQSQGGLPNSTDANKTKFATPEQKRNADWGQALENAKKDMHTS